MNKTTAFRHISLMMVLSLLSFVASAADYYVVVGAFYNENNARAFSANMRKRFPDVSYRVNQKGKLFYVHVLRTEARDQALSLVQTLKAESSFQDAWIFSDNKDILSTESVSNEVAAVQANTTEVSRAEELWNDENGLSFITGIKDIIAARQAVLISSGDLFTFIVETADGKTIEADIHLETTAKKNSFLKFRTGEYVALRSKKNSEMLTVVCDVMGYRTKKMVFNLQDIARARDIDKNNDGVWEVRFKPEKIGNNEITVLKNTIFQEDAALLETASKTDLDKLLAMMNDNPGYKIMIHTHCNKGLKRNIKLPNSQGDYFDVTNPLVKTGSDKKLTKERGRTMRNYLVQAGIDGKRIQFIGWGSMGMPEAKPNATTKTPEIVEVELLDDGRGKVGSKSAILLSSR